MTPSDPDASTSHVSVDVRMLDSRQAELGAPGPSVNDEPNPEVALRREALKQKGAGFLSKALVASGKGEDPFNVTPATAAAEGAGGKVKRRAKDDPDVIAFGQALEEGKQYVFMALHLICTAAFPVLVKLSFVTMQTPAVLTFLHMLGAVLALWVANHFDVFKLEVTGMSLRGSVVRATLTSMQMLCTFSALHHNSVNLVLVWTYIGGMIIDVGMPLLVYGTPISSDLRHIMTAAIAAGVLEIISDRDKVPIGFLMMTLWMISKVAEWWWKQLKQDATAGGLISALALSSRIRELSDEEDSVTASTMAFLQNALPAVPVLILGFIAQEGKELVDHELSVPAVRVMLMACGCYTLSTVSLLMLANKISPNLKLIMRGAAVFGTIVFFWMEESQTISLLAVLFTFVAIGCWYAATWLQRIGSQESSYH